MKYTYKQKIADVKAGLYECMDVQEKTIQDLLIALKQCVRVLSHIKDAPGADPLKYVPIAAYKDAYKLAKEAIFRAEGKEV